jgi:hypothetical protein
MTGAVRAIGRWQILALISVALGLAALYLSSRASDSVAMREFRDRLQQIRHLETRLGNEVLESRAGELTSYDPIVAAAAKLETEIAELGPALPVKSPALAAAVAEHRAQGPTRRLATEHFLRATPALRNSVVYFPLLVRELVADVQRNGGGDAAGRIEAWRDQVMLAVHGRRPPIQAAEESDARNALVGNLLQADLEMLFAHARQILLRNAEAAVLAREIAGFSTSETMTRIEALYHEEVREAEERERWIGLTLHLLGAAAALGLVLSVLRIREISQRLAKTNQELEREIEFRKMVEAALDAAKAAAEEASRDKSRFIADMA